MEQSHPPTTKPKITSILIQPHLQKQIQERGIKLTYLTHNALEWKDRIEEQAKELIDLRNKVYQQELKITRLERENIDLLRLRVKVLERLFQDKKND